jgi:hypothetical protein
MLGGRKMKVLQAHYKTQGRALTATMLAKKVGYRGYRGINLCYGLLAASIEPWVGVRAQSPRLFLLLDFNKDTNGHWVLKMRPQFAQGLKRARWV